MALHEAGETARSMLGAFREQPLMLALVIIILALLGFLYYDGLAHNADRRRQIELLYENRKYVGDLLARCRSWEPPHKTGGSLLPGLPPPKSSSSASLAPAQSSLNR